MTNEQGAIIDDHSLTPATPSYSALIKKYAILLLFAAAVIPAAGALGAPFYWIDDHSMILDNALVNGSAPLLDAFIKPHFGHYAPFHELLIRAQWMLFGAHPLGFRLVSVLLHGLAAVCCFTMLKNLTGRHVLACGIAVLWAVHPIQPESVDWISEQKTLWCGVFTFAALATYSNPARSPLSRMVLTALLMIIAGLGKSHALIVGPLILLYELCTPIDTDNATAPRARRLAAALPFLVLSAMFAGAALWANKDTENVIPWSTTDTVLHLPGTLLIYLRMAYLPWTVSFFEDLDRVSAFSAPQFYGKLFVIIALFAGGVALVGAKRRRMFIFCALAWVLALGPMLNVSATTFPAYDRFQYLALPFLFLGTALQLDPLLEYCASIQSDLKLWALQTSAWGLAFVLLGSLGFVRGQLFGHELDVMLDATQKAPGNAYAYAQFANTLFPEWRDAKEQNRLDDEQKFAHTIAKVTEKARTCWNFNEFYITPGPLLVMTGQVLHESGFGEQAVPFLEAATSSRWSRFKAEADGAHRLLAMIQLERAAKHLIEASRDNAPPEQSEKSVHAALEAIEASRQQYGESDTAFWCTYLAHKHLAKLSAAKGDVLNSGVETSAATDALKLISAKSSYYLRAQEALRGLGKQ